MLERAIVDYQTLRGGQPREIAPHHRHHAPVKRPRVAAAANTAALAQAFKAHRTLLVGGEIVPMEDFLQRPVLHWMKP